jgi:VWFA-related protein
MRSPDASPRLARHAARLAAAALLFSLPGPASPQAPAAPQAPSSEGKPTYATGTARVVLDVVVRDKKGRPVADIRPEEIEVYEEGMKQTVESFKRVETEPPRIEGVPPAPERPDASRQLNVVTFVFDQLGDDGRRLAQRAADAFLEKGVRPNTWVSVFRVDQRLAMVLPFTNDAAKVKRAVAQATSGQFIGVTDEKAALDQAMAELEKPGPVESAQGPPTETGGYASRAQARALANMLRLSRDLQRQQLGTTSLYPLMALVKGHQTLAGRKTLVYLSEGLEVQPQLDAVYRSVISEANRANVSVYAIDARGLDTSRAFDRARDALDETRRLGQEAMESGGAGPVSKDEIKMSETAESALRANVQQTMQELAESTGGFLIANTNNFKPGVEKIVADIAAYYQLNYTPPPSPFDGRFRRIEVKVLRKDVVAQSRSGYFALPPGESSALFPYEVPLLGALSVPTPPHDFTIRAAALRFGPTPAGFDHKLVIEVPLANLAMQTDDVTKTYRLHFSLMAMVKDEAGQVVERYSEDYPFTGPADRAEALKLGNIVFKRRIALPPGKYVLETAGQDRSTGNTSTVRTPLTVPASGTGPRMSSLSLIRRVDQLPPDTKSDDPLDYQTARIVPNLDAPISLAVNPKLWLYFAGYPAKGAEPPKVAIEFHREGRTLAKADVPLPAADPDGVIRYIGAFPTTSLMPGTYEVKVAMSQGGGSCAEEARFSIVP